MPSAAALELKLTCSRWRRRLLAAGYTVAGLAWLAAGLGWLPTTLGLAMLGLALRRDWHAPWPRRLSFRPGRGWCVGDSRRAVLTGQRLHLARTGRFVTSITWGGRWQRSLVLFDDAFCDTGHKRLRRLLRHSDTGAPC